MVSVLAWIIIVVSLVMIISAFVQHRKKRIPLSWTLFWTGIWIFGSVTVLFSGIADIITLRYLGAQANLVVLYLAVLLLLFLVFRTYIQIKKTQAQLSSLVEEIAKDNARKK